MTERVAARWRALMAADTPEKREVSGESALRMIFGVNDLKQPYIFAVAAQRPRAPQLSNAITVEVGRRTLDSHWTLTLRLIDPALTDAFLSLLSDVAEKSAKQASEPEAMQVFLRMLADLQHLLLPRRAQLSLGAVRGLVAELWFGFVATPHGHTPEAAVFAWNGPFGGDQDFNFPVPSRQFEVKSIRPGGSTIEISSASQLDRDDVDIAVVSVEDVPPDPNFLTLPDMVETIRGGLTDPGTQADFNRRFAELSLDLGDPWYAEQHFDVQGAAIYSVGGDFPRLQKSLLPTAIARVQYRLDLDQLAGHLVAETTNARPEARQ